MEIKYSRSDSVATLYLDPAVNFYETCRELENFFDCADEIKLRVIVISSKDGNDFGLSYEETSNLKKLNLISDQIASCPIPVVVSVRNNVTFAGLKIVDASHLCVAAIESNFLSEDDSHPFFTANQALSKGLVNQIVPKNEVEKETERLINTILELAPIAISSCLQAVSGGLKTNLDEGLALETKLFAEIFSTEDMREGTCAFLEKRKPVFKGK